MINQNPDQADHNAQQLIRRTKQITRRRFTPEEKVRILIEGIRGELPISVLCRREGIGTNVYYKWLKDPSTTLRTGFMEAGKGWLKGDTFREANGLKWRPSSRRTSASRNWWPSCR